MIRECDWCGHTYLVTTRQVTCSHDCQRRRKHQYRLDNPDKALTSKQNYLWHKAKERAEKKGMVFSIARDDIIIPDICPILKIPLTTNGRYVPSIDRKDNSIGYTPDNIWVISWAANRIKNDSTEQEQKEFAKWVLNN